jgi:signal transduction histidine kinase
MARRSQALLQNGCGRTPVRRSWNAGPAADDEDVVSVVRRRAAALVAAALIVLGLAGVAARLDAPADPGVLRFGGATWSSAGVVVDVPDPPPGTRLRSGDLVTAIGGHPLAEGPGGLAAPPAGAILPYTVDGTDVPVRMSRPEPGGLARDGWGDLVFVVAFAALALALYRRRPEEPATGPLLVGAAGLLGSTLVVVAGLSPLAVATGGPPFWLFQVNVVVVYALAWGALLALSLLFVPDHPLLRRRRRAVLRAVVAVPPLAVLAVAAVAALAVPEPLVRLGVVHVATTLTIALTQVASVAAGVVAYRQRTDPVTRGRLRWLAGSATAAIGLGLAGWLVPELVTGRPLLPQGAIGLAGLPFVAGIGVALRRHRLFDIERLVNRSLVYGAVVAVLVAGYAAVVAVLAAGLRLSSAAAAALAAAVTALALAPVRTAAQGVVNRLMYGERDDPAGVLARLGARMGAAPLPDDVLPAVVETVARSLRVPYVAVDLADAAGEFRTAAQHGTPAGPVHVEPLRHHGETVGRLRISGRGPDDPLEPVDVALVGSLAGQVGPAVQAVRLHADLVRSRAEVVALREDERRRLRRDLHDGLGPSLAAIGLKAGLAARSTPVGSPARGLLDEIGDEVKASIADVRRVVEELRPPALDELGLVGAVRSRAAALSGDVAIEVSGSAAPAALPAAVETAAYRIAAEAMTNAVRHGGGSRCTVAIESDGTDLVVAVRDDGAGIDPARPAGVGLRSMRERAAELGGACDVGTPDGGGTLVRARLPLTFGAAP